MTRYMDWHEQWMKDPAYAREYDAREEEFGVARALTDARVEAGASFPSTRTLKRIARAAGTRLRISFEPDPALPITSTTVDRP